MSLRLAQAEIIGHYEGPPAFLRVHFNPDFDLVLDDRFDLIHDPDYLLVLPTQYGQGSVEHVGKYIIRCVDVPHFSCGYKAKFGLKDYVIVFEKPPTDEQTITGAIEAVAAFLTERQGNA